MCNQPTNLGICLFVCLFREQETEKELTSSLATCMYTHRRLAGPAPSFLSLSFFLFFLFFSFILFLLACLQGWLTRTHTHTLTYTSAGTVGTGCWAQFNNNPSASQTSVQHVSLLCSLMKPLHEYMHVFPCVCMYVRTYDPTHSFTACFFALLADEALA